jgi:hypothetical protein
MIGIDMGIFSTVVSTTCAVRSVNAREISKTLECVSYGVHVTSNNRLTFSFIYFRIK